jgi:hypothetical protein
MRIPIPLPTSLAALVCVFAFASSAVIAADAVYKWKDANGQSHYSQSPPPSGTKYEMITPVGGPASASADVSAGNDAPASASTTLKPGVSRTSAESRALRKKNCETAKANLALIQANPNSPINPAKPASGPANPYASDAPTMAAQVPRAQEIARAQSQINQFCDGN